MPSPPFSSTGYTSAGVPMLQQICTFCPSAVTEGRAFNCRRACNFFCCRCCRFSIRSRMASSGSSTSMPLPPSTMTSRPSYSGRSLSPMATMAGIPMVRARMAVWLAPEPPVVTKARIFRLSSCMVSLGARSSAASTTGPSKSGRDRSTPVRAANILSDTSFTSALRSRR